jgi:TonB family protein
MLLLHKICFVGLALACGTANGQQDCGFAEYHPTRISHFDKVSIGGPTPEYPAAARKSHWSGTVQIGVIVDVQGKVVKTCPVYAPGKPIPHESLIAAASAAAKQWRFKPNFGFGSEFHPGIQYVQHVLLFRFVLPDDRSDVGVKRERFNPADLEGFAKSPTEHIIVPLDTEFYVERVQGVIVCKADGRPLENVLFEVRGPSEDRTITQGRTDRNGRFRLKSLRPGVYLFKTTANGFQSVIGTIVVGFFKQPTPIHIELPVGV